MTIKELLSGINKEDKTVADAVQKALPAIEELVSKIVPRMMNGGRLFYIGAGTSGRLGILDASECPPTYGVPHTMVIGIIAGGDKAIRKAVEFAEDDQQQAIKDIEEHGPVTKDDIVVGIAASGRTPYVIGGIVEARKRGLLTACVTCNADTEVAKAADIAIEAIVGPEFVTGSTRMKAGTAQKMILNMITTTTMIKMGRVKGNKMVDMQLSNNKLVNRGITMLIEELDISYDEAKALLEKYGNVRRAIENFKS